MVRAKNPMPNTLSLDMRCEEGRCLVQVDIDFLNAGERQFLFRLLEEAKEGRQVGFSVDSHENGERTRDLIGLIQVERADEFLEAGYLFSAGVVAGLRKLAYLLDLREELLAFLLADHVAQKRR